ncbi:mannitol dehydrogenase [Elizabethkingia anophelis]|nr:mannitol dehydrogenase [Elizabethkingia anophelis]
MKVLDYYYNRKAIQTGILHIGVGNFHRAHQAFYTNQLLRDEDQSEWGICGAGLLPSDEKIVNNLRSQNLEYTLTVCGRDGRDEVYKIGAINDLIWTVEAPQDLLNKIADSSTKIITLTITEGGYNLDKATNEFILENESIQHDLKNPESPTTVFGFITEGLRLRKAKGSGSITILSCDNLQHNGNTAQNAFTTFIAAQDKDMAEWVQQNVTFPNSMVDRITPVTTPEDVKRLNEKSGITDKAPVYCEDFVQWVIEDNFIAGRPAWERVGVTFTKDVTAYENMKLSLLNASHTLLSYPSFLAGYRKVDEAMRDKDILNFVQSFMDIDITPHVPAPKGIDLNEYKQTLTERFANRSVSDQTSRLCSDGISKFPVYIMPNLIKMINHEQDLSRVTFLFAAYRHYLKYKVDDNGLSYEIAEPWITSEDQELISSDNVLDFLNISAFRSISLGTVIPFTTLYISFTERIKNEGIKPVLQSIIVQPKISS